MLVEHELTPEQVRIYDAYAGAFGIIHNNLDAAMRAANITGETSTLNAQAKSAARSAFESAKQRFFGHLLTSMKTPSLVRSIERDLDAGHAAVIQIVSTGEALMERRLAEIQGAGLGRRPGRYHPARVCARRATRSLLPVRSMSHSPNSGGQPLFPACVSATANLSRAVRPSRAATASSRNSRRFRPCPAPSTRSSSGLEATWSLRSPAAHAKSFAWAPVCWSKPVPVRPTSPRPLRSWMTSSVSSCSPTRAAQGGATMPNCRRGTAGVRLPT